MRQRRRNYFRNKKNTKRSEFRKILNKFALSASVNRTSLLKIFVIIMVSGAVFGFIYAILQLIFVVF